MIWEHFPHYSKVQRRRMPSTKGRQSLKTELSVAMGLFFWNCGTEQMIDDSDQGHAM